MTADSGDHRTNGRLRRRAGTIPAILMSAIVAALTLPFWLPVAAVVDLTRLRFRLPLVRLLVFGLYWAWVESAGLLVSFAVWATGRGRDQDLHYRLMAWWTNALMRGLQSITGLRFESVGEESLAEGNAVVLSRHASLADSLVSAWIFCCHIGLQPRYVLKQELLADPCLDVVGHRVPNCFVDRGATDDQGQLARIADLSRDLTSDSVAVIFPEGTRASTPKRQRALERIAESDPGRAARMACLQQLLPPRMAGTRALLGSAPSADVVLVWHTGFEGLHDFRGILRKLAHRPAPAKLVARRVRRNEVPAGRDFDAWLDEQWLRMDAEVAEELGRNR